MNAYIYAADLYCDACGETIRADIHKAGKAPANPDAESTYDSSDYPKGPYANGGGESDSPCHCGACGVFLENPLTRDGVEYVRGEIARAELLGSKFLPGGEWATWRAFYAAELEQMAA